MGITRFPHGISSMGVPILGGGIGLPFGGNSYFVDSVNGNDGNEGTEWSKARKTLASVYTLATSGNNDVIYMAGNATAYALAGTLTWSKTFTHLVGVTAPTRYGGRCRITASADMTPMINVTGQGCIFANIHLQHGYAAAGSLVGLTVGASHQYYYGCHFESPMNDTIGTGTVAYEGVSVASGAQNTTFERCTFGNWTVQDASNAGAQVELKGNNAPTYFNDCWFLSYTDDTAHVFVDASANPGGEAGMVVFDKCRFCAALDHDVTLTIAVSTHATQGTYHFADCTGHGFTDWTTTGRSYVWISNGAAHVEGGGIGANPA